MCAFVAVEINDPYDEKELDPVKSGALNSSLWEMVLLQKHAVPEVANAARFISKSLPLAEFDLAPLLEMKECDVSDGGNGKGSALNVITNWSFIILQIFDQEVKNEAKHFTLGYERPTNFAVPQTDIVTKYFDIL